MKQSTATYTILFSLVVFFLALPQPAFSLQPGAPAPDFELADISGRMHRLSDYRGKVVIINFWASWCPECIEEMPSLDGLYAKLRKQDLVVLGIASDRKKEPVLEVLRKVPVTYPLLPETNGGVFIRKYTVLGLPTTVVVDRAGTIAERFVGRTDFGAASFSRKIQELLNTGRRP